MPESNGSLQRFHLAMTGFRVAQESYCQEIAGVEGCLDLLDGRLRTLLGAARADEGIPQPGPAAADAADGPRPEEGGGWTWLRPVLEAAPSYVYIWCKDRAGNLLFANPAAAQSEAFGAGQHLDVLSTGHPSLGQVETLPLVNGPRWIRVNRHPLKDARGRVTGVIAFGVDITDLRQAEASLSQSEQRYQTLFETMTEALLICELTVGEDGELLGSRIQDANPAFAKAIGWPLSRLRFQHPGEVLPVLGGYLERAFAHRRDAEPAALEDLCLTDPGRCFEARCFWPDGNRLALVFNDVTERRKGEQRLLRMNEELETQVQGRTRALETAVRELQAEIAVRKQAEAALRASEAGKQRQLRLQTARLRVLEQLSGPGTLESGLRALLEHLAEELPDHPSSIQLLDPGAARGLPAQDAGPDAGGPDSSWSEAILDSTGQPLGALSIHARAPVAAQDQELLLEATHLAGMVIERSRAQEHLRKLSTAMNQSAEAIAILGLEKQVIFANPAFYQILGLAPEAPLTLDFAVLLGGFGGDPVLRDALDGALQGLAWKGRVVALGAADTRVQLEGSISPVRDEAGTICTLVAVLRDVTREAQMDRHLRQVEKMDALGAMASGLVHDFNNILMAIVTTTELIEWQLDEGSPVHAKLEIIHQAARRAQELNRQILSFSRKADETRIAFDLSGVAREAAAMLGSTLPAHTSFETDIAPSVWVTGDPGQFHQVIVNLVINAGHAMEERGGELTLGVAEIEVREGSEYRVPPGQGEGRFALITVGDTGCGMSAETQEKVFEPFFTTRPDGEGTGLGLSVVHSIVAKHGGTIQVSSEPGAGTQFRVFVPSTIRKAVPVSGGSSEALGGTEHILFVDDDDIVAALAKQGLLALGYQVTAKTSVWDALEVFQARPEKFDLLVTSLDMPHLSGTELARRLRQIRPDLPAILLTGVFAVPETAPRSSNRDETLAKPLATRDLARAIRRVVAGRRLQAPGGRSAPAPQSPEGPQPMILLAEDSSVTRGLLRSWLAKSGFRVREARDGQEAWELFCAEEDPSVFSMLLTDLDMPRMDGLELVRRIRGRDPEIPVLVLTASEDMGSLKEALHLHVNEFLIKPFDSNGLRDHVQRLAARRRVGMEAHHHAATAQAVRLAQRTMEAVPEKDLPICSICEPLTDAGGDVFRCLRRPDGSVVLVLADVAGHSVTSSYAVAAFLGMLATFVQDWWGLAGLFHRLNQNIQTGPFPEHPVAVLAAHWDPRSGRLHVMNAGIPYGIWHRPALGRTQAITLKGAPLGLFDRPILKEKVLVLEPGDRVVFGTDGLFDIPSPDQGFFRDQVPAFWARAVDLPLDQAMGALCAAARNHGHGRFPDDVLAVGLEQPAWLQDPHELLCAFPAEAASVERADMALTELLAGHPRWRDLDASSRFDLMLALHEALTNAIEHGNGGDAGKRVALAIRLADSGVAVRVVDEGPGFDLASCQPPEAGAADRGRGVPILRATTRGLRMRGGELKFQFDRRGAVHETHE